MPLTVAERQRRYRERNPERVRELERARRATPKGKAQVAKTNSSERAKAARKAYYENNKDKFREYARKNMAARRVKKTGNGVFQISPKDLRRLLASPCAECGAPGEHMDHIVPVSRGGAHSIGNLQMLCAYCNGSKKDKFITEWRAYKTLVAA